MYSMIDDCPTNVLTIEKSTELWSTIALAFVSVFNQPSVSELVSDQNRLKYIIVLATINNALNQLTVIPSYDSGIKSTTYFTIFLL